MSTADLEIRAESYRLAAITGLDHRTCMKALVQGADSIHPRKMREELRPHVEAWHARTKP